MKKVKQNVKMTEKEFINSFRKKGFNLYKSSELNKKLRALVKINKLSKIIE